MRFNDDDDVDDDDDDDDDDDVIGTNAIAIAGAIKDEIREVEG